MKNHDWPGNIRELQNFIKRAVVLSPGTVLRPTLTELKGMTRYASATAALTLADAERDHIVEVLNQVDWMIGGRDGAALRLGLPRTTLLYKMRKLGIKAPGKTTRSFRQDEIAEPPQYGNAAAGGAWTGRFGTVGNV